MEHGDFARSESRDLPKTQATERPGSSDSSEYDVNESTQPLSTRTHREVKRSLESYHIFLITVSGTIGMGLLDNSGEILRIAGPAGGIMAYIMVGVCVVCVMEGIAEMIGHWPIANCMVEFVAKFVDRELAIVVGLAYWYSFAISFATLVVAASNLASFWQWSMTLQDLMFTVGIPIVLVLLNCMGVLWYAYVESVLGVMKIALVVGSFLSMVIINNIDTNANTPSGKIQSSNIDDGFQHDPTVASSPGIAVLVAIPIVAYAYIGVEIVAVTALEARHPQRSLKFPAKWIGYLAFGTYLLSAIGFYLNASWTDSALPVMEGRKNDAMFSTAQNITIHTPSNSTTVKSTAIVVIATLRAHIPTLPSFINAGLICAVLSTSNTSLYVASRTLFGLTRGVNPKDKTWGWLSRLSVTSPGNKIPAAALAFSALAFCWVPFLRLSKSYSDQELQEIMSGIATVAVVLVWAALCLAFIRYRAWLKMHERELFKEGYTEYNHWSISTEDVPYKFRTLLCWAQPIPAYVGLISCLLIVFVFATASWWNGGEKIDAVLSAMAGPIILLGIWFIMKYFRHRNGNFEWFVKLGNWDHLSRTLDELGRARKEDDDEDDQGRPTRGRQESGVQSVPLQQYPNFQPQLRSPFERSREDSAYPHVSPTTGIDRRPLAEQDMDVTEQARDQNQSRNPRGSVQTSFPDIYRVSISGGVPKRKPVSSTASGLGLSPRNSGQSTGEQDPMLPIQETSRDISFGSPVYDRYSGSSSEPRRSSRNELVPPDRQEFASGRFSRSHSSNPVLELQEQDLANQDARREEIWGWQRQPYDLALSPQSPQHLVPPQWNPNYIGMAVSEPDLGPHGQTLHRQRGMTGLRGHGGWGA